MPVIGMESEFNVWLDEVEINPEPYFQHPSTFIDGPLLKREKSSVQLPTGGAVYFDRGVIEVVTPVIELAPHCTARMVRNLWEQIGFVRDELTKWGDRTGHTVRLKAYSSHYNISHERKTGEWKLARLLAYLLPVPVMIAGANRRSTGVGVRPRGERIEVTVDFTPDPGLMVATATLVVGITRAVMEWPSYELSMLDKLGIPVIGGVIPGKHTTRKGFLTKDFHYERSPYTSDIDAPAWTDQFGRTMSLRQMARAVAWHFRKSIREYSDPFSFRLLFAVLEGRAPSLLDLPDRPKAYEDVGNLCRWGMVIDELREFDLTRRMPHPPAHTIDEFVLERAKERERHPVEVRPGKADPAPPPIAAEPPPPLPVRVMRRIPARYLDRRSISLLEDRKRDRRKSTDRRRRQYAIPFPDRRLTRSAYEQVFLKLVSGSRLRQDGELLTPVGMKGWYHAVFRRSDGSETLLTIDELLRKMADWV
ncbi:MAG TPA: hypothetical protein VII75_06165 [Thermoanaerobaculia bacterium]|nr:hypothetical protein [Thermoanaerobaculia bacterium]